MKESPLFKRKIFTPTCYFRTAKIVTAHRIDFMKTDIKTIKTDFSISKMRHFTGLFIIPIKEKTFFYEVLSAFFRNDLCKT